MYKTKVYTFLAFLSVLTFNTQAYAVDINADETENFIPIENKNMGLYIVSKVVDAKTNKALTNVQVESSIDKVVTDQNGEFFLKANVNDSINIKYDGYKDISVKVSEIKGKFTMDLVPDYLSIFPYNQISLNYRNIGISEKLDSISISGRVNDSFSADASIRLFNNLLIGVGYENLSGIYNRSQTMEKSSFSDNTAFLRANWIYQLFKDQLDISFGLKGYFKSISSTNIEVDQENPRDNDYLDFNNQHLTIGPEIEIASRPIKYIPFVVGAQLAYYPYIMVLQDPNALMPKNLGGFDYNVYARYDFMKLYVQAKFAGRNSFQNTYNSSQSGLVLGLGYSF